MTPWAKFGNVQQPQDERQADAQQGIDHTRDDAVQERASQVE